MHIHAVNQLIIRYVISQAARGLNVANPSKVFFYSGFYYTVRPIPEGTFKDSQYPLAKMLNQSGKTILKQQRKNFRCVCKVDPRNDLCCLTILFLVIAPFIMGLKKLVYSTGRELQR